MDCLEQHVQTSCEAQPETDISIMDGAVLVNILRPVDCKTFGDYAVNVFAPHVIRERNLVQRVDIDWDQYFDNSLKTQTREKLATGPSQRRPVGVTSPIQTNWQQFLRLTHSE